MALTGIPISENECIGDSLATINSALQTLDTAVANAAAAGVTKIIAGTNISITPTGGTGDVTINAASGGGGTVTNVTGTSPISVANGTTTPSISLGIVPSNLGGAGTVNGLLKANGAGTVSAAVAGTDYLTSATLGSSPAAAKAWVTYSSVPATPTIHESYNITGITDLGVGRIRITLSFTATTSNFACCATSGDFDISTNAVSCVAQTNGKTTTTVEIHTTRVNQSAWIRSDESSVNVVIFE